MVKICGCCRVWFRMDFSPDRSYVWFLNVSPQGQKREKTHDPEWAGNTSSGAATTRLTESCLPSSSVGLHLGAPGPSSSPLNQTFLPWSHRHTLSPAFIRCPRTITPSDGREETALSLAGPLHWGVECPAGLWQRRQRKPIFMQPLLSSTISLSVMGKAEPARQKLRGAVGEQEQSCLARLEVWNKKFTSFPLLFGNNELNGPNS